MYKCVAAKRFLNVDVMTVQCVMDSVWVGECVHACVCVCAFMRLHACMCVCVCAISQIACIKFF